MVHAVDIFVGIRFCDSKLNLENYQLYVLGISLSLPPLSLSLPPSLPSPPPFIPPTSPFSLPSSRHPPPTSLLLPPFLPPSLCPSLSLSHSRALYGVFINATRKAHLFVLDRVRTNQMPNMGSLYSHERTSRLARYDNYPVPLEDFTFDIRVDTEMRRVRLVRSNQSKPYECIWP